MVTYFDKLGRQTDRLGGDPIAKTDYNSLDSRLYAKESLSNRKKERYTTGYVSESIANIKPSAIERIIDPNSGRFSSAMIKNSSLVPGARYSKVIVDANNPRFNTLQKAVSEVNRSGNGRILVSVGTYTISSPITITAPNVEIVGEDRSSTVIIVESGANIGTMLSVNAENFTLRNITLDGNSASAGGTRQVLLAVAGTGAFDGQNALVDSVNFVDQLGTSGAGCYIRSHAGVIMNSIGSFCQGSGFLTEYTGAISGISVNNCWASNCKFGFEIDSVSQANACRADTCSGVGFIVNGNESSLVGCRASLCGYGVETLASYTTVTGCTIEYSDTFGLIDNSGVCSAVGNNIKSSGSSQIYINTAVNSVIQGNILDDGGAHGIELVDSSDCVISNNYISYNGTVDNTHHGVFLNGALSDRNIITGNLIETDTTNNYAYGIREGTTAADYNLIHGNIVKDGQTARIGTQGANTLVADNTTP